MVCIHRVVGVALLGALALFLPRDARAAELDALVDSARLLATGGVSQIEGAGGGGLSTWALITGYGSRDAVGGNVHATIADVDDFRFTSYGAAVGLFDRVELSYARQRFDTEQAGAALGLGTGFTFEQDVFGAKVRLLGDAVYDQDLWLPQISAGVQFKRAAHGNIIRAIGGASDQGVDYYLAASKLFLDRGILLNATVRATKANQFGLLGFGGPQDNDHSLQFEGSAVWLINRHVALGADYRTKPDNLAFAQEDDAYDLFVALFPSKHFSVTAAYVDLGEVALQGEQNGVYFSIQTGF